LAKAASAHFFPFLLLALDRQQQQFLPILDAVHTARSQFGRQTVAFAIEQQQRVIAGGLEVSL
jgi:hypothetical protein